MNWKGISLNKLSLRTNGPVREPGLSSQTGLSSSRIAGFANRSEHIRRVGLLLDEQEANDIVERYANCKGHLSVLEAVRQIFEISGGHIGVIVGLVGVNGKREVSPLYGRMTDKCFRNSITSIYGTGPH